MVEWGAVRRGVDRIRLIPMINPRGAILGFRLVYLESLSISLVQTIQKKFVY